MGMQVLQRLLLFNIFCSASALAANFTFQDGITSAAQLLLVGDAVHNSTTRSVLLTGNSTRTQGQFGCGMVLHRDKVSIRDASFSTSFTFTIRTPYDSWGDGFAFTFRGDPVTEGSAGEYMCLINATTMGAVNHVGDVFAVEFDTFRNAYDPSNNHIGVDVHTIFVSSSTYNLCGAGVTNCSYLVNHGDFTAWIDYDSPNQLLEVRFRNGSGAAPRPAMPVLTQTIALNSALQADEMYVGFVGATGLKFEVHEIKAWSFSSTHAPAPKPGKLRETRNLSLGLGIPLAAVVVLGLLAAGFILRRLQKQKAAFRDLLQELGRSQVQPYLYSYNDIKSATRDFHPSNKLGEGGFGIVYKGTLVDGTVIAAKKMLRSGNAEDFLNEVILITGIRHRNLVMLRGCCTKDKQQILVYEYVENRNLAEALWGANKCTLDWPTRLQICEGIARGLSFLHEDAQPRIIHRDIKANNILLDHEWKPKIADFGLARLFPDEESHLSTMHIAGTMGYMAPEYATRGQLTSKADVYSFGVLLLEIISGRKNIHFAAPPDQVYLLEWAWACYEKDRLFELLDGRLLAEEVAAAELHRTLMVAIFCVQPSPGRRPSMSSVLAMLVGEHKMDLAMRLPTSSHSGERARLLAQVDLNSPFSDPAKTGDLKALNATVLQSHPPNSTVLDASDMTPR